MQQVATIPDNPPKKYGLTGLMTLQKGDQTAECSYYDISYYRNLSNKDILIKNFRSFLSDC